MFDQASVFVSLFDEAGNQISVPVTKMSYFYSDKDTDFSSIDIESGDASILDIPQLQNMCKISVQWGYLAKQSTKRLLYIIDRSEELTSTGVCLQLFCSPKGSTLRDDQSQAIYNGDIDAVAKKIADEHGLNYVNNPEDKDPIVDFMADLEDQYGYKFSDNSLYADGYSVVGIRKPGELETDTHYKEAVDNTSAPKLVRNFVTANRSKFNMLSQEVMRESGGPYAFILRDDNLVKVKVDTSLTPFRSYHWKGGDGELLSFKYTTKNKENLKDASKIETGGWDTINKTYNKDTANSSTDKSTRLGSKEPVAGSSSPKNTGLAMTESSTGDIYNKDGDLYLKNEKFGDIKLPDRPELITSQGLTGPITPTEGTGTPLWNPRATETSPGDGTVNVQIDATLSYTAEGFGPEGQIRGDIDNTGVPMKARYQDYSRKCQVPGDPQATGFGDESQNKRKEANMQLNNATMSVLGDTRIESHQITTILGVGSKNSGNWYIIKSTHVIEPGMGYIVNTVLNRNGVDSDDVQGNFSTTDSKQNTALAED